MTDHLSRVFRSSFPSAEATDFRTNSWKGPGRSREKLEPLHVTLLHAFAFAAKQDDETGITLIAEREADGETHRSYRALYHDASRMAGALAQAGVRAGDRVLIVLPTSLEFVIAFFAIELLQAVPVPSYPPAALERAELALDRLAHIVADCGAEWCISNGEISPLLGELNFQVKTLRPILVVEDLLAGDAAKAPKARAFPEELAFIQYTSGSTGHPKGVMLEHRNVVANIHAIGQASQITRKDVVVSWLPLYHDMGLIGAILFSIYWRLPLALMSPTAFLKKPVRWLRAIHKYGGTMSPAPNFAFALCVKRVKPEQRAGLDLSSWRLALNGAEPVNLRTVQEFEKAFQPYGFNPRSMLPVYGLAESCLAVAFSRVGELRYELVDRAGLADGQAVEVGGKRAIAVVCVGTPVPGHSVLILDERGQPLPERQVGHVVVRGPSVMKGYYGKGAETSAVLRDGWLWTGDLGYFADGQLYITGRAKDLIIMRGKNHYAEDLERVAETVEGVRPGGTAAFGVYDEEKATDIAMMVCETQVEDKDARVKLVESISEAVGQSCGVALDEVVLVPPGTIPKTSSGKRQRALCRDLYLKDALARPRSGKLRLAMVFARSGAGHFMARMRRMMSPRRAPD